MPNEDISLKEFIQSEMQSLKDAVSDVKNNQEKLREDFNTMEKGRLTALELRFVELQGQITALQKSDTVFEGRWTKVFDIVIRIATGVLLGYIAVSLGK